MDIAEMLGIKKEVLDLMRKCEGEHANIFKRCEEIAEFNTAKVMNAFFNNRVSETHFIKSTGYGYDDIGRETIERIYADIFKAEDALVRIQFVNGTHALSTALFGNLLPGDTMLSITGEPYDTLAESIGIVENKMSLINLGVKYRQVDLINNSFNFAKIKEELESNKIKLVFIGRSRGYSTRESLTIETIEEVIKYIKEIDKDVLIMVDNCYGEFVEKKEPIEVGADIIAGSLIKNLGGSLCETGGYIVGKKECVERAAERLTAPGIGKECGATLGKNKEILQGLFMAPHIVLNAVKTSILTAAMMEKMGYVVSPTSKVNRTDIIQSVTFGDKEKLVSFIQGIQSASPVDSFVRPEPWDMPGYTDPVIMAAGTFVSGASIELSADAPVKPPYMAYLQGGITYESASLAICRAISNIS
ncbi:MAG: methionine gamma-lyase family protein [Clostridia bacterium]|nr:methionine gamma-lyase family protein [Clostridia bacterium]